jgi:hypothetical protein
MRRLPSYWSRAALRRKGLLLGRSLGNQKKQTRESADAPHTSTSHGDPPIEALPRHNNQVEDRVVWNINPSSVLMSIQMWCFFSKLSKEGQYDARKDSICFESEAIGSLSSGVSLRFRARDHHASQNISPSKSIPYSQTPPSAPNHHVNMEPERPGTASFPAGSSKTGYSVHEVALLHKRTHSTES